MSLLRPKAKMRPPTLDLPLPELSRVVCDDSKLAWTTDEALFEATSVRIAFTERTGGMSEGVWSSLDLATHVSDDAEAVYGNRRRILDALGMGPYLSDFINPRQVHGTEVFVADESGCDITSALEGADAVVALRDHIPVLLCYADCVPVIVVAPTGAFAVIHAGWRGAIEGIVGKTVGVLCERTGCDPRSLNLYIGPHIGPCCYETSREILSRFVLRFGESCDAGQGHLSLAAAVRADATSALIEKARIAEEGSCTCCENGRYFSYRAAGGVCGRHGAIACGI